VIARHQLKWFLLGFAAAGAVDCLINATPALAQTAAQISVTPLPTRQQPLVASRPASQRPVPPADDEDMLASGSPPRDAPVDGDIDPEATDPSLASPTQTRRATVDGAPAADAEPMPVQDGIIETGEPQGPGDGDNPAEADTRRRADIDAFEKPASGYDAIAFQVEIEPILDRRPVRLARFEPYDPVGIRRGAWVIFPDAEFGIGRLSNVFSSTSPQPDTVIDVRPTVRAVTNWRQHAVEVKATGLASFYSEFGSENDRAYTLEARGRFDFSRRTNIEALVSNDVAQDSRSDRQAVGSAATRANITTNRAAAALNHRFNRLTLQLRGSVTETDYSPVADTAGLTISNDNRDQVTRETAARATWAFKPALAVFSELALNDRTFKGASGDGIFRNSKGDRTRLGVTFGSTGGVWRGEVSTGYGHQRPDDMRLREIDGLLFDANLAWRISPLSSLLFTARTDFAESTNSGSSGALVRAYGIEARHAFQRQLIGTAAIRTAVSDYKGITLTERETTGELGAEYFINRNASVFSRYQHVIFDTSAAGGNTVSDVIRVGLKIRQ
jgi:hypothetical protein